MLSITLIAHTMNLNANSKIVLLASAAFLIAAGLYGWSSASSPEAGIPFTAEGTVVATEFRPEHDATSRTFPGVVSTATPRLEPR